MTDPIHAAFDHLVIGAETLDAGRAWARETFGADIAMGGEHPLMGTHNRLARLPVGYLEIIAVDPDAAPPARERWYGLDAPGTRARLAQGPAVLTWVVAVPDLDAAVDAAKAEEWEPGAKLTVTRGDLEWRMTVPADGSVPEDGVLPTLIEWPEALGRAAPRDRMKDAGLELSGLTLRSPDRDEILRKLRAVGADMPGLPLAVEDGPNAISAGFSAPKGVVIL